MIPELCITILVLKLGTMGFIFLVFGKCRTTVDSFAYPLLFGYNNKQSICLISVSVGLFEYFLF